LLTGETAGSARLDSWTQQLGTDLGIDYLPYALEQLYYSGKRQHKRYSVITCRSRKQEVGDNGADRQRSADGCTLDAVGNLFPRPLVLAVAQWVCQGIATKRVRNRRQAEPARLTELRTFDRRRGTTRAEHFERVLCC
jgi:hypothetical protein